MKNVLFLLMTFFVTNLFAQDNVRIDWGEANKNQSFTNRILGETNDAVVTLASKGKDFFIEIYDKQKLSLKKSYPFRLPKEQDKQTEIEKIHFFPETQKILLFTSLYLDKKSNVYYYEVDLEGKVGKSNLLLEIDVENKKRSGRFGFELSHDDNTMLVYHTSKLKKEKMKQIRVKVIDADANVVADLEDKIPMKDDKLELFVGDFTFDSNGFIHMLVTKPTKKYQDFFFYTYNSKNEYKREIQQIELDKDHVISNIGFTVNGSNQLVAVGYYSDFAGVFRGLTIQGLFSFVYDPKNKEVLSKKLTAYTQENYNNAYGEKVGKRMKKGIPPFHYVRDIVLSDNGAITLVSEFHTVSTSSKGPVTISRYVYGDILVTSLDNTGEINWLKSIPKMQIFTRQKLNIEIGLQVIPGASIFLTLGFSINLMKDKSVYLSYLLSVQKDKLCFIYNDNPKNITTPIGDPVKPMNNLNKGVPTLILMGNDGELKREVLYGAKNDELILRPRINKKVNENTIYVYGNRKKLDKIGRVEFE